MLISCLLPTFNRYPNLSYLVKEAVHCFNLQDHQNRELIICNDTPGQQLVYNDPRVRVINREERFPTLGAKLDYMLKEAQGEYICRWDDDDLSLPWRLSTSLAYLSKQLCGGGSDKPLPEWRPENHWYMTPLQIKETQHPGNTHVMSIWHRDILGKKTTYPGRPCASGEEDQTFNGELWKRGYPRFGDLLKPDEIFYIYRWGTGSAHLSGKGGGQRMQQHYEEIGQQPVYSRSYTIQPRWRQDYVTLTRHLPR